MKATDLIQLARTKKRDRVLGFLKLAFNNFAYPVYLFGSFATGKFHGHSDVDIVIIAPDAEAKNVYRQASKQLAELGMNYDILIAASINRLNPNIVDSLQAISANASPSVALQTESLQSNVSVHPSKTSVPTSRNQRGLTLVELMIAMLLGLFLLGGLLQIFISSKQTYRMQEGLSRLQENGRFAIDYMARDIRLAGYKGCSSRYYDGSLASNSILDIQDPPNPATDFLYDFNTAIQGFEAISTTAWSPAMVSDIPSPLVGGSDVITIRRADDQGFSVTAHVFNTGNNTSALTMDSATATTANLQAAGFLSSATTPANQCAIAVVSNCQTARVFQVSAITGNVLAHNGTAGNCTTGTSTVRPGNVTNNLIDTYAGGQVRLINTISYFVRTANGQSSLYQRIGANLAQELVEGVEGMEILYGVDTDAEGTPGYGTANYYVTANQVNAADWAKKVVSVRISLLVATIDNNLTDQPTASFIFNGQNTPADRKLRRVFTSTIGLRNRLP